MTRRPIAVLVGIELVQLITIVASGFWEGGVVIVRERVTHSGMISRGAIKFRTQNNFLPVALLPYPYSRAGYHLRGNAVKVEPGYPQRWEWTPQWLPRAYSRSNILRLKETGVIVPLWLVGLIPFAFLARPAFRRLSYPGKST